MTAKIGLSVVIPAYNEGERLGRTLERIQEYLDARGESSEILVVDDGSVDTTAAVARSMGVHCLVQPRNRGKGAALRRGVQASRGRRVLLTDADLSTPIADLARLEARFHAGAGAVPDAAPVVFGSRAVAGAELLQRQPLYRELMGKTFNRLIQLAGIRGVRDTQCGFKLLDGDVARALFRHLVTPGFAYDVELLWLAQRAGLRVTEVGVRWENSPSSRVQPLLDPPKMLLEIARFRWLHRNLVLDPISPSD